MGDKTNTQEDKNVDYSEQDTVQDQVVEESSTTQNFKQDTKQSNIPTEKIIELGMDVLKTITKPLESFTDSSMPTVKITSNPAKLKVTEDDIWAIDHREIYRRGFSTLTSEEKDTVLVSLLIQNGAPSTSRMTTEEAILVKQTEHSVWKERQEFTFKKIVWWASLVCAALIMIGIVVFASKTGVLTDQGGFNSILNAAGAIYQQLFGSIPTVSK